MTRPETAQQAHDKALIKAVDKLRQEDRYENFDPITNAMKRHPDLTRETAERMAKEFGF